MVNEKKIVPTIQNYSAALDKNKNILEKYFSQNVMTEEYLDIACKNGDILDIAYILNNNIFPKNKHYIMIFDNKKLNAAIVIDLFVKFGYQISNDDIMMATKKKIKLYYPTFTKKFVSPDEFY